MSRLAVEGSLLQHNGSTIVLRGFNLQLRLGTYFAKPRAAWDGALATALPGATAVRLVILHWDDMKGKNDCRTEIPPFIEERCIDQLEEALSWSSRNRLWAVVALRGSQASTAVFKVMRCSVDDY